MRYLALFAAGLAAAASATIAGTTTYDLAAPARVSLDGVAGAFPGMTKRAVEARFGVHLRVQLLPGSNCGTAALVSSGLAGYALFENGRLGSVWFRRGAVTGRGIRIGSTVAQLRRAYPRGLRAQPNQYTRGARDYYLRRARKPRWELRFDASPGKRITQIAFGNATVHYSEGCA